MLAQVATQEPRRSARWSSQWDAPACDTHVQRSREELNVQHLLNIRDRLQVRGDEAACRAHQNAATADAQEEHNSCPRSRHLSFALGGDNQRSTRGFYEKTDKVGAPASNISHVVSEVIGHGGTSVGERRDVHAIDGLCPSSKGVVIWRVGAPVQSWWRRIPPLHVEFENGGSSTIVTRNGCEVLWCALQYVHWSKDLARPQARMNWAGASNSILSIRHGCNVL